MAEVKKEEIVIEKKKTEAEILDAVKEKYAPFTTIDGKPILSNEYIQAVRSLNRPQKYIVPQQGGQEIALASPADIRVYGGMRGGGKTFIELLEPISDIQNGNFSGTIFRKNKDDFRTIIETANMLYRPFGKYNVSAGDMTWNFTSEAVLDFRYYAGDTFEKFQQRFQGREIPYIGIDEATQMPYKHFKYLMTCNRNSKKIRNRMLLTCNPDPNSWLAEFIDWWIGDDGLPIRERNGVLRYCFIEGDNVNDITWGDSREEVYELCKDSINKYWRDEYYEFSTPQDMFINSVTFIIGELAENKILLKTDPAYLAKLVSQDEEQKARDLEGNWKYKEVGSDLISNKDMENFFANTPQDNGLKCVTCDPALQGGDNAVFLYWEGWHIKDIMVTQMDSRTLINATRSFLERKGVLEDNFAYDVNGVGQNFKGFFPRAVEFNNNGIPTNGDRNIFENLKSEYAYQLVGKFKDRAISIDPSLLDMVFHNRRFSTLPLRDIMRKERKVIKKKEDNSKNWGLITKKEMIQQLRWSPDFLEAMITRFALEKKDKKEKRISGLWYI